MAAITHEGLMDRVYRHQRHFYDATRKYYLLGRDEMLAGLRAPRGGNVLEIGCGTGRNLVKAGSLYPDAQLYGVDISTEMLRTAQSSVARAGIAERTKLAQADAAQFDPQAIFGLEQFDRIFISYAVSMIPQWKDVLTHCAARLAPGGELHIVDFGDLADLPVWTRKALYTWLRWYHVTPRNDLGQVCAKVARGIGGTSQKFSLYRDFAWIATIRNGVKNA